MVQCVKKWANCAAINDYIISIIIAYGLKWVKMAVQIQMDSTCENTNTEHELRAMFSHHQL